MSNKIKKISVLNKKVNIYIGDSLEVMKKFKDLQFDCSSFSPPYGKNQYFDIRYDFEDENSKFLLYFAELSRISKVNCVNFTQLLGDKSNQCLFIEKFIIACDRLGIELLDRWIIEKPSFKPRRGILPLNNFEFILVFKGLNI